MAAVLHFLQKRLSSPGHRIFDSNVTGIEILAVYFSICSNILHSIYLAAFFISDIIFDYLRGRYSFKNILPYKRYELIILALWLISLLFEANGGRSTRLHVSFFSMDVIGQLGLLYEAVGRHIFQAKLFFSCWAVLIIISLVVYQRNLRNDAEGECKAGLVVGDIAAITAIALGVWLVYIALVTAKMGLGTNRYIMRMDVIGGAVSQMYLIFMAVLAYAMKRYRAAVKIMPLILFIIVGGLLCNNRSFANTVSISRAKPEDVMAYGRYMIQSVISQDKANAKTLELTVIKGDNRDNWPIPNYFGQNFTTTLHKHGIISRIYKGKDVKLTYDNGINRKFNIYDKY